MKKRNWFIIYNMVWSFILLLAIYIDWRKSGISLVVLWLITLVIRKIYINSKNKSSFDRRVYYLTWVSLSLFLVLSLRLFQIQVLNHNKYVTTSNNQSMAKYTEKGQRGRVFDINGNELAYNMNIYDIIVDPKRIVTNENWEEIIDEIGKIVKIKKLKKVKKGIDKAAVAKRPRRYFKIAKKINEKDKGKIDEFLKNRNLRRKEVYFESTSKRNYLFASNFNHLIGYLGYRGESKEKVGVFGVEKYYENYLKERKVQKSGYFTSSRFLKLPTDSIAYETLKEGRDVYLTIDYVLQHILNDEVRKQAEKTNAETVRAIIMDPRNGKILATSSYPEPESKAKLRNRLIQDRVEPGSIFKPIIMASAFESGLVNKDTLLFNEKGYIRKYGYNLKDSDKKAIGYLQPKDILRKSSNVGMALIAERMDEKVFEEYLRKFGFYDKTGVDLSGEINPWQLPSRKWDKLKKYTLAFGQGIAVTPLQVVTAFSAVINGGNLYKPYIVDRITEEDGTVIRRNHPEKIRRVISKENSDQIRKMLEAVVEEGTGKKAKIEGLRIGGKTGTAQIPKEDGRGYQRSEYLSSFMGFFPIDKPKYVMLLMFEKPEAKIYYKKYGGWVAAPIFKNVAERMRELDPELRDAIVITDKKNNKITEVPIKDDGKTLPNLENRTIREVLTYLRDKDIELDIKGEGRVVKQNPAPSIKLEKVKRLKIELE